MEYEEYTLINSIYENIKIIELHYINKKDIKALQDISTIYSVFLDIEKYNYIQNYQILVNILKINFIYNKECLQLKQILIYAKDFFYYKGCKKENKCIICNIKEQEMVVCCNKCLNIQYDIKCYGCYLKNNTIKVNIIQEMLYKKENTIINNRVEEIISHLKILKNNVNHENNLKIENLINQLNSIKNKSYQDIFKILLLIDIDTYIPISYTYFIHLKNLFNNIKNYFIFKAYIDIDYCFNKTCKKKILIFRKCLYCYDYIYVCCPNCEIAKYCTWKCFIKSEDLDHKDILCNKNKICFKQIEKFFPGILDIINKLNN